MKNYFFSHEWQVLGVIFLPEESTKKYYALGFSTKMNNEAKATSLWQGLMLLVKLRATEIIVLGDSQIIINYMRPFASLKS